MRKLLAVAVLITMLISAGTTVAAAPAPNLGAAPAPTTPDTKVTTEATSTIELLSDTPAPKVRDPQKVKERHRQIADTLGPVIARYGSDSPEARAAADSIGLQAVRVQSTVEPLYSSSQYVAMSAPVANFDPLTGEYTLYGNMRWKTDTSGVPYWQLDGLQTGTMGGDDGWGLYLSSSQGVNVTDGILQTNSLYSWGAGLQTWTTLEDINPTGIAIAAPDTMVYKQVDYVNQWKNWDYSANSSIVYMWARIVGSRSSAQVKHQHVHTWATTGVLSMTVGTGGLSVTYSNGGTTTYSWKATSSAIYW